MSTEQTEGTYKGVPQEESTKSTQPVSEKEKKAVARKAIWLAIPVDIDNLEAQAPLVPTVELDADGNRAEVHHVAMNCPYHLYVVPGGPGQKKALNTVLAKHNIDIRNIGRVKMFVGEKSFDIEPQYNIRFK